MILTASTELKLEADDVLPVVFMLRPRSGYGQWVIREEYIGKPHLPMLEYTDDFGNLCQRALINSGKFSLAANCTVDTADGIDVDFNAEFVPIESIPDAALQFLLPSRYCQCDMLGDLASQVTAGVQMGYQQVEAVREWLHKNISYQYGMSNASTSAVDTAYTRTGVCRDMAHLGIALCRALNIPARFVSGYLHELDPMDLHAWFEAYIGYRWFTFDATQSEPRGNRIALAYGRDAADVALVTHFGPLSLQNITVRVSSGSGLP